MKKVSNPKVFILFLASVAVIGPAYKVGDDLFEISKNLEIFTDLYKNINLFYAEDTQPGDLMKTGIDAMLESLDPYTTYIPESKMEDYRFMTTGQYGGIGSLIRSMDDDIYISEPYQGFPAQRAGLQAGDRIISVDGKDISGKDQEEVSTFLKGSPGSTVRIIVERPGEGEMSFQVSREEIKIPDVPYSGMLDNKVGYIKLNGFTQTASKEAKAAYKTLEEEGMEQLVFDLRGNGGGLLREAVNIVNFFVPRGTEVVSTKGNISDWDKSHKTLNEPLSLDIPVAVLIDGSSASASEIVSGTLQDLDRAIVVGEESFGKGLVQQTKDLAYGSKLKITVAKYYTPSGRCIQKLDYFEKNDNGVAEEVPDSLVKEFKTKSGRVVYDGRGIYPDVKVEQEEMGKVVGGLFQGNHFFRYATDYVQEHPSIAEPEAFQLSHDDIHDFISWLADKELSYDTESLAELEELVSAAKKEKYYDEYIPIFKELERELSADTEADILRFERQVRLILESEIISRYHFQNGRIIHGLNDDPVIDAALEHLDSAKYNGILNGQG